MSGSELMRLPSEAALTMMPVMDTVTAMAQLEQFKEFVKNYLKEGDDFGVIPGTLKPTLYKPGGEKLAELYGLYGDVVIEQQVEDWDRKPELFDYTIKCVIRSKRDKTEVAVGYGSCNSYEARYRYRDSKRSCPNCGGFTIIKGKADFGGGWVCWDKAGAACKAKFKEDDPLITTQVLGRIDNEDIPSLKNTILKMAKKRAFIDGILAATRSSALFTQDVEDFAVEVVSGAQIKQRKEELSAVSKDELGKQGFADLIAVFKQTFENDAVAALRNLADMFGWTDMEGATSNKMLKRILETKRVYFDAKTQSCSGLTQAKYDEVSQMLHQLSLDMDNAEASRDEQ